MTVNIFVFTILYVFAFLVIAAVLFFLVVGILGGLANLWSKFGPQRGAVTSGPPEPYTAPGDMRDLEEMLPTVNFMPALFVMSLVIMVPIGVALGYGAYQVLERVGFQPPWLHPVTPREYFEEIELLDRALSEAEQELADAKVERERELAKLERAVAALRKTLRELKDELDDEVNALDLVPWFITFGMFLWSCFQSIFFSYVANHIPLLKRFTRRSSPESRRPAD